MIHQSTLKTEEGNIASNNNEYSVGDNSNGKPLIKGDDDDDGAPIAAAAANDPLSDDVVDKYAKGNADDKYAKGKYHNKFARGNNDDKYAEGNDNEEYAKGGDNKKPINNNNDNKYAKEGNLPKGNGRVYLGQKSVFVWHLDR